MMSCLMFKSLSHFEFIFVHGMRVCSSFIETLENIANIMLSKSDTKEKILFHLHKVPNIDKFIKTKKRIEIAWDWEFGE